MLRLVLKQRNYHKKKVTRDSEENIWLSNSAIYLIKPHQESPTNSVGHRNGG